MKYRISEILCFMILGLIALGLTFRIASQMTSVPKENAWFLLLVLGAMIVVTVLCLSQGVKLWLNKEDERFS